MADHSSVWRTPYIIHDRQAAAHERSDTFPLTMARLFKTTGTFRSLANYNYRLWASGAIVSNVGTWMQRVAQDWLVLAQLTNKNADAVGIVMSLQCGPQLLLLPITGHAADHVDRRKLLFATQAAMGTLALFLGLLVLG